MLPWLSATRALEHDVAEEARNSEDRAVHGRDVQIH